MTITPAIFPNRPISNITPFTYRDSYTFLERLEQMIAWINNSVVNGLNTTVADLVDSFGDVLSQVITDNDATVLELINQNETFSGAIQAIVDSINNRSGMVEVQQVTLTDDFTLSFDPTWPTNLPVVFNFTQDATGGHVVSLPSNVTGLFIANPDAGAHTQLTLVPTGGGQWQVLDSAGAVTVPAPTGRDDTFMLNSYLSSGARTVNLTPGQTYHVSDSISVPNGVELIGNGSTINAEDMPIATTILQKFVISAVGSEGNTHPVTTAIARWSRSIKGITTTTGLKAGDLVLIKNNEKAVAGFARSDRVKGEFKRIVSIVSPTEVTLDSGVYLDYGTSGLSLVKINPATVRISNLNVVCGGVGSGHTGVHLMYNADSVLADITVVGGEDNGICVRRSYGIQVDRPQVTGSTSSTTLGNTGYGVSVIEGSAHVNVSNGQFRNCRHFVAGGGIWPAAYVRISGSRGEDSSAAGFDCHESTFYWTFEGNTVIGAVSDGFLIRGQNITLKDNMAVDCPGVGFRGATWDGVTEQAGLVFDGNRAVKCGNGISILGAAFSDTGPSIKRNIRVANNRVSECLYGGISIQNFDNVIVTGNNVSSITGGSGIYLYGLSASELSTNVNASNNVVNYAGSIATHVGVKVANVNRANVSNTSVRSVSGYGMEFVGCNEIVLSGNNSTNNAYYALMIDTVNTASVNGGEYSSSTNASGDGIRCVGSSNVSIVGTVTANPRYGINATGCQNVIISLNNVRSNGAGSKIYTATSTNVVNVNNLEV